MTEQWERDDRVYFVETGSPGTVSQAWRGYVEVKHDDGTKGEYCPHQVDWYTRPKSR